MELREIYFSSSCFIKYFKYQFDAKINLKLKFFFFSVS